MIEKLKKKLGNQVGESLAETLIAVLVIAFATMLLAGMISATSSIVMQSESAMEAFYAASEGLETLENTEGAKSTSMTMKAPDGLNISEITISVVYAENTTFESKPVIAYRMVKSSE